MKMIYISVELDRRIMSIITHIRDKKNQLIIETNSYGLFRVNPC